MRNEVPQNYDCVGEVERRLDAIVPRRRVVIGKHRNLFLSWYPTDVL